MKAAILALSMSAASLSPGEGGVSMREAARGLEAVSPAALSAATRFLSSSLLDGRETGTRGHEIAALYVATQMQAIGLEPAAEDGRWEQVVPLRAWRVDPAGESLTLHGPAQPPLRLVRDVDFIAFSDGEHSEVELDGALAFVGYGISAPEYGYDDLKGVDLTGKIAVVLWGAPSSDRPNFFPPVPRAVLADRAAKMARLAARGAAGVIFVYTPDAGESRSWEEFVRDARVEGMAWVDGSRMGDAVAGLPARVVLSPKGLEKVAVAAGVTGGARAIFEKAEANRLAAQDWPLKARIGSRAELRQLRSANVLGLLRGSDPVLSKETVVVTAHLDDGARDDGAGVAVLLEVARALSALPRRPARSVLFAATTGEGKGLAGSSYLARHPVVDPDGIVASLDVDGAPNTLPFADAVARGADHSTLGSAARSAAAALGVELSPDPELRSGSFLRSDPWSFVRLGVPYLHVVPGSKGVERPGGRWEDVARFARLQFLLALAVADGAARPAWNPGDFFQQFARRAPSRK